MTPCRHMHDRRRFLQTATRATLAAGFAGRLVRPGLAFGEEPAANGPADVGIARGSNMEEAVRRRWSSRAGSASSSPTRRCSSSRTSPAPCRTRRPPARKCCTPSSSLSRSAGRSSIIVADRSFSPLFTTDTPKTIDVMERVGQLDAVKQAVSDVKAPVVACGLEDAAAEFEQLGKPADTEPWRKITHPLATNWPNGFEMAELLFAVDHVINVPVIKTHFQAWFTMSMKAFVGMSHHRSRREFHMTFKGSGNLADQKSAGSRRRVGPEGRKLDVEEVVPLVERMAELNLGIKPALNILDGTKSFVFGGPSHGDVEEPKLIVASRDRIAADATGVAVLKRYGTERRLQNYSVWENPFIMHGIKIGLGIDSVDKLNLKHAGIEDEELDEIKKMLV